MKKSDGFQVFDHTADVGLEIRGHDWSSFYLNAARGLLTLYGLNPAGVSGPAEDFNLTADTPEDLLVTWLSELIFLISTRFFVPVEITILSAGPNRLSARLAPCSGAARPAREIKAPTYHGLNVRAERDFISARIILDV
jgi:SHS2 domain-containing protein